MRTTGRCSSSCMIAGAANATSTPASHPNRTSALAPKTKDNDTPPLSTPSTGTGKRFASVEAARRAATPSKVVRSCGSITNATAAAKTVARPSVQTGATTVSRRFGMALLSPFGLPLPVAAALGEQIRPTAGERDHKQGDQRQQREQTRIPFQHCEPPEATAVKRLFLQRGSDSSPEKVILAFSSGFSLFGPAGGPGETSLCRRPRCSPRGRRPESHATRAN